MNAGEFTARLVDEFSRVAHALTDLPPGVAAAAMAPSRWVVHLKLAGPVEGTVAVGVDGEGGTAIARAVMMMDEAPPDAAISDALKEMAGQTIGGLSQTEEFAGLRVAAIAIDSAA